MAGFAIDDGDTPPVPQPEHPAGEEQHGDEAGHEDPAPPPPTGQDAAPQVQEDRHRRPSVNASHATMGGPFAFPRREWSADRDVEMEDVSSAAHGGEEEKASVPSASALSKRVQTMPTLPTPPVFRGSTAREKQSFMKAYEAYCRQLSALETAFFRPFRMPVGACVEDERRRLIAMFDICKPLDTITETDLINYFWDGRVSGELDFDKVKALVSSKLKMDVRLTDANSRVSKLAHEMYQILEKENMEWMVESEPKKVVQYMIDALAPEPFQRTVRNEMARESNKPLLKSVVNFITWLRASCKEYVRWEPSFAKKSQASSSSKFASKKAELPGAASTPAQSNQATVSRSKRTCLKCGSETHRVKECPQAKEGEAEALLREWREKKPAPSQATRSAPVHGVKALQLTEVPLEVGSTCVARIENVLDLENVLLDSGADINVVSRGLVERLREQGVTVNEEARAPHKLATFDGRQFEVTQHVRLDTVQIQTTAGPLLLRRTPAWVFEQENSQTALILSRPVMERLGYSVDAILANACDTRSEWDMQDLNTKDTDGVDSVRLIQGFPIERPEANGDLRAATPEAGPTNADDEVARVLAERVAEAAAAGLDNDQVERLETILLEYRDVFRVAFGRDPPVRVEPLRVRVREGATPVRTSARRYPPAQMAYLDEHVRELLDNGLAVVNPASRWASPPRIVNKHDPGTYRMTVDTRAVNERTEPIQWPMPILESALGLLEGSSCFFTLDWFRGYWQLPLHPDSQEMFSIMTHRGIITPTRVLMGGTDAVAYCQHVVEEVFRPILYNGILAWLDDILGYAADPVDMLEVLERVLAACKSFGLKLHPGKCHFFLREARWCGKLISSRGVEHCPSRIEGLVSMPDPVNAGQLHQLMCAMNWMRQNIPQFTQLATPLLKVIDAAAIRSGSRKTKQLSRVVTILFSAFVWLATPDAVVTAENERPLQRLQLGAGGQA